jgi:hypothetical protein
MKITATVDGKDVKITLTKDQLAEIAKQTSNKLTVEDITYETARELLKEHYIDPDPKGIYTGHLLKLVTIICAVNFIDNNYKEWQPNWKKSDEYKYVPYFCLRGSGLSFGAVHCYGFGCHCSAGLYYKKESSAKLIANKEIKLYSLIL